MDALAAALGGFELRDEDLVLDRAPGIGLAAGASRTALCAGLDGEGRGILVVRGGPREAVLLAIDALAWCDARRAALTRRLGADPELAACVAVVVDDPDAETLAALATLRAADLRVFEAQNVRSSRGVQLDLTEVVLRGPDGEPSTPEHWEGRLDGATRSLVERVRAGIARIDPDARSAASGRAIVWRSGSARLVELRTGAGKLEARIRGERFDLDPADGVERVLEGALRVYLDTDARNTGEDRGGGAEDVPLLPNGPLLSDDELAALRGD